MRRFKAGPASTVESAQVVACSQQASGVAALGVGFDFFNAAKLGGDRGGGKTNQCRRNEVQTLLLHSFYLPGVWLIATNLQTGDDVGKHNFRVYSIINRNQHATCGIGEETIKGRFWVKSK
jgi:hypothetical protein